MHNTFRLFLFLLVVVSVLGPNPAAASVDVQGDAASLQVVANHAHISEVLSALGKAISMRYDMRPDLDAVIDGMYRGPLKDVLGRVLSGYNYVFVTREGRLEVIVVGRVGRAAVVPSPRQTLPENKDAAAQWRSNISAAKKP
jgi:hypothetical protein